MIVKVIGGAKRIVADVNQIQSIANRGTNTGTGADDILVFGNNTGNTARKAVTIGIDRAALTSLITSTSDLNTLGLSYDDGIITLNKDGSGTPTINIDIESQIDWIGLVKRNAANDGWTNWPSHNPVYPQPAGSFEANATYLIIVHTPASSSGGVQYSTAANVTSLIDFDPTMFRNTFTVAHKKTGNFNELDVKLAPARTSAEAGGVNLIEEIKGLNDDQGLFFGIREYQTFAACTADLTFIKGIAVITEDAISPIVA